MKSIKEIRESNLSLAAAKATNLAVSTPTKANHLAAVKAHKEAQGFFKGQSHDYHLNKAIEHAKKASEMKEEYGAGEEGSDDTTQKYKDETPGQSTREEDICETASAGLAAKAKKTGFALSTLRKVYRRGVAAWNSGHRPGTTPQQWGMARVNSYVTKGKGTYHGADKDLRSGFENDSGSALQEVRDSESGLPKAYVAGLSTSTAKARAAHFDKADKLSDRDPEAYKPAPGDATAKTKESEHTKKYRAMFGEDMDEEVLEACWDSHKQVGFKMKDGRRVPNCVPKNESVQEMDEAHKLGDKVTIVGGPKDVQGKTGRIGEIRPGSHKTASKTYTVDHDAGSVQLGKEHIRAVKEGADEDMAKHHAAAQAAKAAGDNAAFHKHMDAKFEVAKKRDAENAKKPVTRMGEALEEACWKGYEAIGMKMQNDRKVSNCVPKEGVSEGTAEYQHHIIGVTMTDPNHPMVSKRSEPIFKKIKVSGSDTADAMNRAKAHYSKKGFKVGDMHHHSYVNEGTEESLDESVHGVKASKFSQKAKLHPSISTHIRASDAHAKAASAYEKKIAAHIKSGGESSEIKPFETMVKHHNRSATLHKFMAHRLVKNGLKEAVEIAAEAADEKVNLKITRHSQLAVNAGKRGDKAAQKFHLDMVSKLKAPQGAVNEEAEYDDDQEEIIMAKGQLLKIADMAKNLADSMDDQDELEAWIQVKITSAYDQIDDVHSYVEYTQDLYDDQPEAEKEFATEDVNEDVAANNDAKELARMQMLVRLGLLDRLKLNTVTRAIKKLDRNTPITTTAEKDVLFELLQNLIGAITSDESIFKKVKFNVANK